MEDSSAPNRATTPPRHAAPAAPGQPAPGSRFWLLVAVGLVATLGAVAIGVTFNQRAVIQASSTPSVLHEDSELPVPEFETTPEVAWTGTFDLDLNAPGTIDEHTYLYTDRAGQNVNALDLRTGEGIWQVDVSELQEATGAVDVWTRAARSQDLVIVHAAGQTHAAWLLNSATGERVAELEVREDEFLYPAGDFWVGLTYRAATDTQLVRLYSFQDSELVSHWEQEMVVPTFGDGSFTFAVRDDVLLVGAYTVANPSWFAAFNIADGQMPAGLPEHGTFFKYLGNLVVTSKADEAGETIVTARGLSGDHYWERIRESVQPVVLDDQLFLVTMDQVPAVVELVDIETGESKWTVELAQLQDPQLRVWGDQVLAYSLGESAGYSLIDPGDGSTDSSHDLSTQPTRAFVTGDHLVFAETNDGELSMRALDPSTQELHWEASFPDYSDVWQIGEHLFVLDYATGKAGGLG